jgi:hypothetical protein
LAKGLGDDPLKKKGNAANTPDTYSGVYFRTSNSDKKASPAKDAGFFGRIKQFFNGN